MINMMIFIRYSRGVHNQPLTVRPHAGRTKGSDESLRRKSPINVQQY